MDVVTVSEKHVERETALQRMARQTADLSAALMRVAVLAGLLAVVIIISILTVDLPFRAFDRFFSGAEALRPSNWLTWGGVVMALAPLMAMLIARRFGGDEAARAITAAWTIAALCAFAELSILAPSLEDGDMPSMRFTVTFVASAMATQYVAAGVYDIARGGGSWWRAPLYGAIAGYLVYGVVYFPGVYLGSPEPWLNWMVTDFAVHMLMAGGFLPLYWMMRKSLKPRGGYGG